MELSGLYTEIVKEHSISAHNKRYLENANVILAGKNPSCGDEIELELTTDNDIIIDAAYTGIGCAISQASVSIMIDLVRGKTMSEARMLAELFLKMSQREKLSDNQLRKLEEAVALQGVSAMPARVKCATMPWRTLISAIDINASKQ